MIANHRPEDGDANGRDGFRRVGDLARDWWPFAVNAIGGIGFGLTNAADSKGQVVIPSLGWGIDKRELAWLSAVAFAIGLWGVWRRSRQLTAVQRDLATAQARARTNERALRALGMTELSLLARSLKHYSTERVSLFAPMTEGFALVARWSASPPLIPGTRTVYPRNEGCLWAAWEQGSAFVTDLPDPRTEPEAWLDAQEGWQIPRETAAAMTMRSRTYAAFRIDDQAPGRAPLGVVIFESQLTVAEAVSQKLAEGDLDDAIKGSEGHRLRVLLEEMGRLIGADAGRLRSASDRA